MFATRSTYPCMQALKGLASLFTLTAGLSLAASPDAAPVRQGMALSDTGITMTGRCPNGEAFHLVSYDKQVEGLWKSFYDFQGPVGVGTVKTKTPPRVMVSRVCIALADMASDEH